MAVKVTPKGAILVSPNTGTYLGSGKLSADDVQIIKDAEKERAYLMRNMPATASTEEHEVDDYLVTYRGTDGNIHTLTLGGVSEAHAWEEASYEVGLGKDEAEPDEIISVERIKNT